MLPQTTHPALQTQQPKIIEEFHGVAAHNEHLLSSHCLTFSQIFKTAAYSPRALCVQDILGMQEQRATWPPMRLGNWFRISKPPPQIPLTTERLFLK